jgi:hypothetical protein
MGNICQNIPEYILNIPDDYYKTQLKTRKISHLGALSPTRSDLKLRIMEAKWDKSH